MSRISKGKCPHCGAGPRKIEVWTTLHGNGKRVVWLKCSACYQRFNPPKSVKRVIPMSEIYAAVDVLAHHNKWRRGDDLTPSNPYLLGKAIDTVVAYFKEKRK